MRQLKLTYHQRNAEGGLVKAITLRGNLELQMKLRDRIVAKLPAGHTLELVSDMPEVKRSAFSRK